MSGEFEYRTPAVASSRAPVQAAPAEEDDLYLGNAAAQEQLRATQTPPSDAVAPAPAVQGDPTAPQAPDILSVHYEHLPVIGRDGQPERNARGRVATELRMPPESVLAIQARLGELGYSVPQTGTYDAATTEAVRRFQLEHREEIGQVNADSRQTPYDRDPVPRHDRDGRPLVDADGHPVMAPNPDGQGGEASPFRGAHESNATGTLRPNDATHQVLSGWCRPASDAADQTARRRVNGELMTEEEAHNYLAAQAASHGMPLDADRINVVGVRGLQGGDAHDNAGVFSRDNTYNDTFFLLNTDDQGRSHVRPFRGTTDPGGDDGGFQVEANQQWDYNLASMADAKLERPTLWPGLGDVVDPSRGSDPQHDLRIVRRPTPDPAHPGQSTQAHETSDEFMAHHSGSSGSDTRDTVKTDSNGCQVIHGDWYPSYVESLRRDMDTNPQDGRLPSSGNIRYTLMDVQDMDRPAAPHP